MSSPPRSTRRARLAAALIIIFLIVLTSLIVYETNFLGWPFASGGLIGFFQHQPPQVHSTPNSSMTVQVSSVQTVSQRNSSSPVAHAFVQVFHGLSASGNPVLSNYTGSGGTTTFLLSPALYTIQISTSLTNATQPVTLLTYSK